MTLLYDDAVAGQPGTHILAIGVGRYPHLLGGDGKLADETLGLRQLESPPVSLKALLEWFLPPGAPAGTTGLQNSSVPLASIDALASAPQPVTVDLHQGPVELAPATRENIQNSFESWIKRLQRNPDNIGVFYFCGHGLTAAEHYLLAEDFGKSSALPWSEAFDISTTIRAIEREVPGAVYYFIDACREISREIAMTLGADPTALYSLNLKKRVIRRSVTAVFATGEGALAYAPKGGFVSRFTSALICALSGYCGVKAPGTATWNVDGESIATAIRQLLEYEALNSPAPASENNQVSEQMVLGSSVPLLRIAVVPKVKVWLDLSPKQSRVLYERYLVSSKGDRISEKGLDDVYKVEVPRGFYEVGALDPEGRLPAIVHFDEELVPPIYPLTLQSFP